jgi:hypothetical protein
MVTLGDADNSGSLVYQLMTLIYDFFMEKTDYKIVGHHQTPTDSKKVMRFSVFIAENDFTDNEENHAFVFELSNYLKNHKFPYDFDDVGDPPGGSDSGMGTNDPQDVH